MNRDALAVPLKKRLLLIMLVCCIQLIYTPTSYRTIGGIEPKLPIDIFPISSIWVLPYVLCYPLWISSLIWIVFKLEDRLFRALVAACSLTFSISTSTFIFFPTYVKAATLTGQDLFTNLLRFIHEHGGRYDAFPSGHVYITMLLALFFSYQYPRYKYLCFSILAIVSVSTLLTGQHYILDVLGGYAVALSGYHFGLWWAGLLPAGNRSNKKSRQLVRPPS